MSTPTVARRVPTWRAMLAAHVAERMDALPGLVVAFAAEAPSPAAAAEAFLSVWRCGYSSRLVDRLGLDETLALLRSAGYRETVGTHTGVAHLSDVDLLRGPGESAVPFERLHEARVTAGQVLFRGSAVDGGTDGLSWTPDRRVAASYAERRGGRLWATTPDAAAYLLGCAEWIGRGQGIGQLAGAIPTVPEYLLEPEGLDVREVRP